VIDWPAFGLLGRHELRRASHLAGTGDRHVVHCPGQPEIGDLDPFDAILQQDVARLDIAVYDSVFVGGGQPGGDLPADAENLLEAKLPLAVDLLL
jgi:hypothetical protein